MVFSRLLEATSGTQDFPYVQVEKCASNDGNFIEVLKLDHVRKTIVDRMREALNSYVQ